MKDKPSQCCTVHYAGVRKCLSPCMKYLDISIQTRAIEAAFPFFIQIDLNFGLCR